MPVFALTSYRATPGTPDNVVIGAVRGARVWMAAQPGFVGHRLLRDKDGLWTDLAEWTEPAAADPGLRASADSLARKVAQAGGQAIAPVAVHLPPSEPLRAGAAMLPVLTRAIAEGQRLRIGSATPGQAPGERVIWPLQLEFWGQAWTCGGWCEARGDFRVFRLDRMAGAVAAGPCPAVPGRDLAAYLAAVQARPMPGDDGVTCSAFQPRSLRR